MLGWALALALTCLSPSPALAAGVTAAILPDSSYVTPGTEFTLELRIPASGSFFNAYDAVITSDRAALTFLQASPF